MKEDKSLESLASLDEWGDRNFIHPADVKGFFKNLKNIIHPLFIIIFLIGPWVTHNGHQLILFDIPGRKFNLFGLQFFAHDTPIIFFVIAGLLVGLSFVTAIWGRIWCGWACPQTVFIESVFRRIETFIEGSYIQRRKMDKGDLTGAQVFKKLIKWILFLIVSLAITHSFLAYFVGAQEVIAMMQRPPNENWVSFLIVMVTTAIILFDFGWFREQFCLIMCPYGRFQSVLLDSNSLAILYDEKRGEPRKAKDVKAPGDCISCNKCVNVCPTGIDIRNGLQMECIACTACIDACDEIMEKVKKPKGLIRYATQHELKGHKTRHVRSRTVLYGTILLVIAIGMSAVIYQRKPMHIRLIRAIESPYRVTETSPGQFAVVNHFKLVLRNQKFSPLTVNYKISDDDNFSELISPELNMGDLVLQPGETRRLHIFVKRGKEQIQKIGKTPAHIYFSVKGERISEQYLHTVNLLGPSN